MFKRISVIRYAATLLASVYLCHVIGIGRLRAIVHIGTDPYTQATCHGSATTNHHGM